MHRLIASIAALCTALLPLAAQAQSACSSDGEPAPRVLVERFIDAGCEACWAAAGDALPQGAVALDWIVPAAEGDAAPLSAAARRESAARLAELGRSTTLGVVQSHAGPLQPQGRLRIAHGPAVNDYVGVVLRYTPQRAAPGPLTARLAVTEAIPAGSEGTQIARHLVRNTVQQVLVRPRDEVRTSVALPEGVQPQRLRAIAWIEDARGRVVATAATRCKG